jgi:hypothetical protein
MSNHLAIEMLQEWKLLTIEMLQEWKHLYHFGTVDKSRRRWAPSGVFPAKWLILGDFQR